MKTRFASVLLALALPLAAQEPVASPTEAMFYKAFYLEKGQQDFAGAMVLYEQFLAQAPEHALAAKAAQQQYMLLDKTGKTKERDAFKAKYGKLIGDVALLGDRPARPGDGQGAGPGGPGRNQGRQDPAARIAELEKQLADAKEAGDDDKVKELEQQLNRMKQMGQRGPGGRPGLFSDKKLADMSADELQQLKDGIGMVEGRIDRMRERMGDEAADKLQGNIDNLKKALEANKLDDAQKIVDEMKAAMGPRRGGAGGGGGGDAGTGRQRGGR